MSAARINLMAGEQAGIREYIGADVVVRFVDDENGPVANVAAEVRDVTREWAIEHGAASARR